MTILGPTNRVVFAHGKDSGPWGRKILALAEVARAAGAQVESPDYSAITDPEKRLEKLLALNLEADKLILVGSSMGGYVSALAAKPLAADGLFLLAPAFYLPGYPRQPEVSGIDVELVHGWNDDVVPVENSLRFAQQCQATTHFLNSGHRLDDVTEQLCQLFGHFLDRVLELPA